MKDPMFFFLFPIEVRNEVVNLDLLQGNVVQNIFRENGFIPFENVKYSH